VRVEFEMLGEKQFSRELLRVGSRAVDARPAFGSIADDWIDWIEEQFVSQGSRGSGGWADLAPSTVRGKGHDTILVDTGGLMREATDRGNVLITDTFMHYSLPDREDQIGRFHQSGTERMPQRRVVEFTDMDRRVMVRKIQSWVLTGRLL